MTVFKLIQINRANNNEELHFSLHSTVEKAMERVTKKTGVHSREITKWNKPATASGLQLLWTRDYFNLNLYWYISEIIVD